MPPVPDIIATLYRRDLRREHPVGHWSIHTGNGETTYVGQDSDFTCEIKQHDGHWQLTMRPWAGAASCWWLEASDEGRRLLAAVISFTHIRLHQALRTAWAYLRHLDERAHALTLATGAMRNLGYLTSKDITDTPT